MMVELVNNALEREWNKFAYGTVFACRGRIKQPKVFVKTAVLWAEK
jgi:hypothetical protein